MLSLRWVAIGIALLAAAPARAQWQRNQYQQEREAAEKFMPAPLLAPSRGPGGTVTPVRIRFYADDDFRAGARWQDRMRTQLADLNRVVQQSFGVRLEAESFRKWPRKSGAGALQPMLEELEQLDRGLDVDWVVGLVSPLPLFSMSFHDLGQARVLGRHFVLRGMDSVAEMQAFNQAFRALEQGDRDKLYNIRKLHKELSIFLHEWAHTLGACHVEDPTRIMAPGYSQRTSSFSVEDANLIAAGLEGRLASRGSDQVDWGPLRAYVEATRGDWMAAEREQLLAMLRSRGVRARAGAGTGPAEALPAAPAIPGLKPLARPRQVAGAAPAPPPAASAPAEKARGPLDAKERTRLLAQARSTSAEAAAREPPDAAGFVSAARMFVAVGALSAGSDALVAAGSHGSVKEVTAELASQRRRLGLPAGSKQFSMPPEAEPRYAQAVEDAQWLMYGKKLREAQELVREGLARFGKAPGLLLVDCELAMRQGRAQQALGRCRQALALMDELPRAHYLLGCALAESGQVDKGIEEIKRAIALDPRDRNAWDSLAEIYRLLGRQKEFRKFAQEHGGGAGTAGP